MQRTVRDDVVYVYWDWEDGWVEVSEELAKSDGRKCRRLTQDIWHELVLARSVLDRIDTKIWSQNPL